MGKPTLVESNEAVIIDLNKIVNVNLPLEKNEECLKISGQLNEAFSHQKAVFLINHGITKEEIERMYSIMEKFLALPDDTKQRFRSKGKPDLHGYIPPNAEQFYEKNKFEIRESFNIIGMGRDLPNEEIPEFSQCVNDISKKFLKLSKLFLQLFAISLDLNPIILLESHKDIWNHLLNTTDLRICCYPPVEEAPHPGIIRCGEHTDYGTFTFLMQDSEGGLEICGRNGEWRRVGHIPGAIFLNTSEMLEVWSSGEYKATLHRVIVPEENHIRNRSRYSMAFFVTPDNAAIVKPLRPSPEAEAKEILVLEHMENRIGRSFEKHN